MVNNMLHQLPVTAYTSQEWFDQEQEAIFSKLWRYAGLVEDITEPGDYVSVQAGLNNLFIIMGKDKELRAFHNICRHRGTQLLRAVGKRQISITCPYHDWTYDFEGNLIGVPDDEQQFPNLDKKCLGLKPAAIAQWRGMLFVHPDPADASFERWIGNFDKYLGPHKVDELVEYADAKESYEIKANWKIVVENYIDVYHLAHLHSGTLAMYDHAKAEYGFEGPHYRFYEPLAADYLENIAKKSPMPLIIPADKVGAWVPMIFPGLGLSETEYAWSIFHIVPLGPYLTRVETRTKVKNASYAEFTKQSIISNAYWLGKIRGKYNTKPEEDSEDPMLQGDFMAEDIYACEQQQKSLQSPYYEVGPAAKDSESPILQHQKIVKDFIT